MSYGLLGTLLLLLPGGASAEGGRVLQSPGQLWVPPGGTAELSCHVSEISIDVDWYKEKPDGSLHWIYQSSNDSQTKGKYSGKKKEQRDFSLAISPVQREDSGVYYCSSSISSTFQPSFGNGTRLVVTNATEPKLSILVPVDVEEPREVPASIPLLCHLRDLPPGWDTVLWQPSGEVTPVTAAAVDEDGVLSAWSITWVPAEQWDGAAACTALKRDTGRTRSVSIRKGAGEGNQSCCPRLRSWPPSTPCIPILPAFPCLGNPNIPVLPH
ncbi:M1-specific T cell receptor beta chain-like isoform X1 [Chroicocephalus ridibundus]|uniref:M1-specific T cell receptor beta chain-like isoform X1 n=1 Tax=Chroicocephalus ridibundus TaxID=1192867 RepID=UPI002FDCCE6D